MLKTTHFRKVKSQTSNYYTWKIVKLPLSMTNWREFMNYLLNWLWCLHTLLTGWLNFEIYSLLLIWSTVVEEFFIKVTWVYKNCFAVVIQFPFQDIIVIFCEHIMITRVLGTIFLLWALTLWCTYFNNLIFIRFGLKIRDQKQTFNFKFANVLKMT